MAVERKPMGKVAYEAGKYFLEVAGRREELVPGALADEAQLKELVGQEVEILYTEPRSWVVGLATARRRIVCYMPLPRPVCYLAIDPRVLRGLQDKVRLNLAKQFLEEKLISKEVYDKLV